MPLLATIDRLILRTNICSLFSSLGIVSLIALLELDAASPLLHALGSPLAICEALLISVLVLEAIARVVLAWTQFDGLVLDWLRGAVLSCFGRIQAALSRARDALVAASRNTTVEEDVLEHFAAIVRNAEGRLVATKQQHSNGEPNDAGSSGGGGSGAAKRATMMTLFSSRSHEASAHETTRCVTRRLAPRLAAALHLADAVLLCSLVLGFATDASREVRALTASALLLPRVCRYLVATAASLSSFSFEPYRTIVNTLAFLVACAGAVTLLLGGSTTLAIHASDFLKAGLPPHAGAIGASLALSGCLMLLIAAGVRTATFFSPDAKCTQWALLGCAALVFMVAWRWWGLPADDADMSMDLDLAMELGLSEAPIGTVVDSSSGREDSGERHQAGSRESWVATRRMALSIGRATLYSDAGVMALAAAANRSSAAAAAASAFAAAADGESSNGQAGSTATNLSSAVLSSALLEEWHARRRAFETEWVECGGAVFSSRRVHEACDAAVAAVELEAARADALAKAQVVATAEARAESETAASKPPPPAPPPAPPPPHQSLPPRQESFSSSAATPSLFVASTRESLAQLASSAHIFAADVAAAFVAGASRLRQQHSSSSEDGTAPAAALASFEDEKVSTTACPLEPPPDRFVLYCGAGYHERRRASRGSDLSASSTAPWHQNRASSSETDPFDALTSRWCLGEPSAELLERMRSQRFLACAHSTWWPQPDPPSSPTSPYPPSTFPPSLSSPSPSPSSSPPTATAPSARSSLPRPLDARAILDGLGRADLPLGPKALFCLCEGSSEGYVQMLGWYGATLAWARSALLLTTLVVLSASLCLACGPLCFKGLDNDSSRYFDKDLL